MEPRVVRLPRLDHNRGESPFVLLHISSAGPRPLDVKLTGTENTTVFAVSLTHSQASVFQANKNSCSKEQWNLILSSILLGLSTAEGQADVLKGVEAVAKIEADGSSMTIIVQKRIEGITQRLGAITLPSNEEAEEDVDLYEWCGLILHSAGALNHELETMKCKNEKQDKAVKRLGDKLDELIQAKADHETELIEKFALLLNEKKLKIRDQQRLLTSATLDPGKLVASEASRPAGRSREAGISRAGKRKAGKSSKDEVNEDDDSADVFEKMDVDVAQLASDSEESRTGTPDEDATADEAEDSEEGASPAPALKISKKSDTKGPTNSSGLKALAVDEAPPPKRDLPFNKKLATPAAKAVASPAIGDIEGSETESDDEL